MKLLSHSNIPSVEDFAAQGSQKLSDPKTEEMIIAALVGNPSAAWPQVKDFLSPEDFSSEQWRLMYRAIASIANAGSVINTITIEHTLRKMGKYDAAGGDVVVSTVGLHHDDNIANYRDILIQLSIKRQAISTFKDFLSKAESDTADISQLLDEAAADLKHFSENATPRTQEIKMQELASQLLVIDRPEVNPPLVTFGETPIARRGDHSLVIGKEKSRKSLLITEIISIYLRHNPGAARKVKVYDTEQDRDDVWLARERIRRATTATVDFFNMRGMHPKARRDFISWSCAGADLIIIDGIRDCMSNIIDADETTEVIVWLEDITVRRRSAIINVLHLNKTDGNARGHIGTELQNKALVTIEVTYNPKTTFSDVTCRSARKKPFDAFSFTHGPDGQYQDCGSPEAPQEGNGAVMLTKTEKTSRLEAVFEDRLLKWTELRSALQNEFGIGSRKAEIMISSLIRDGLVLKNGRAGDPKTIYKLAGNAAVLPPEEENKPEPAPLFDAPLEDGHQPSEDLPF